MRTGKSQRNKIFSNICKVLLCDEPTGNLDRKSSAEVIALYRQIQQEDRQTVIIVTHDPQIAAQAERVIRIEDGRIIS